MLALPADSQGVLPDHLLAQAIDERVVSCDDHPIPPANVQPASLDLRLGDVAYRLRCSFLPGRLTIDEKVKEFIIDELDLSRDGAVLETNRPYLIPLRERLALPPDVRAKANPKSSTGRVDVFTRVISDGSDRFDEIQAGYTGPLFLEVVPLSFAIRVRENLTLTQLRLATGRSMLSDDELRAHHADAPLLYKRGVPVRHDDLALADGLFLSLDLVGDDSGRVGYRARESAPLFDFTRGSRVEPEPYWEAVTREDGNRIVLSPQKFYLLMSEESVAIQPTLAAEMTAYDPTSGELRTHYAGFFDPGFGYDPEHRHHGSRAALEVRAHDVPFMIEHGQRVFKFTFERMLSAPARAYGATIGSSYQWQDDTLGKHFTRPLPFPAVTRLGPTAERDQLSLRVDET
jgi:dCTP deaminase